MKVYLVILMMLLIWSGSFFSYKIGYKTGFQAGGDHRAIWLSRQLEGHICPTNQEIEDK